MPVKIKGIDEIKTLFPDNTPPSLEAKLVAYKWYKIGEIGKLLVYLFSIVFGVFEVMSKIFLGM